MKPSLLSFVAILALAAPARADVENDLGFGARASALANAVGAIGGDYSATVYNPGALIVPSDRPGLAELDVGVVLAFPNLWVQSLGTTPLETCAPGQISAPFGDTPCVTRVRNTYGVIAGARFDVGRAFGLPGLVLGLAAYLPIKGLVASSLRPDDSPTWLLLTDRTQHIVLHAALAYRIVEWLSIGLGARITFDEETFITGVAEGVSREIDPSTGEERIVAGARLGVATAIYGRASPTAGLLVAPLPELRFGFAWRGRIYSDDWGWSRLSGIEGVGDIGFLHHFVHIYRPHELSWSVAWRPLPIMEYSAELTWALWSDAPSPNYEFLEGRFGDILVPAFSGRVTAYPGVDILAGYRYARRPYDDLGGPTNLLAADAHSIGLGVETDLDRLIDEEVPFTITLALRLTLFEDREEVKNGRRFADDRALVTNPGYPGYRYGGQVPSVQLGVRSAW